ncbi:prolyl oligopeptidase family protein [Acidobacteriota bacterium]
MADQPAGTATLALQYPETRTVDHVDHYHGIDVPDPYRWLEDINSNETRVWTEAQNSLTHSYLDALPSRRRFKERITELWNYEKFGVPFKRGGRYFMTRNDGLQNQSVLYTVKSLEDEPRVLLDPNTLSEDGTIALSGHAVSEDGKYFAYGLARSGSDWQEWKVLEVETGKDLPDKIKWVKFSKASWTHDSKGFFYSRYDEPVEGEKYKGANYYHKLYYHRLGTSQEQDVLVYENKDQKEWGFGGTVTEDGAYLIINIWEGTREENLIYYRNLKRKDSKIVKLITGWDANYSFIDNKGSVFYFKTDFQAPRAKVIAIDIRRPRRGSWKVVIPEGKEVLKRTNIVDNKIIAECLKDAQSQVRIYDMKGNYLEDLELPGVGSVSGFGGRRTDRETFYAFTSFTIPSTIYRYDLSTGKSTLFRQPELKFRPEDYETRQVFFASKDGTKIPMFLMYKKGLVRDGNNPVYISGYGGFNISITPHFKVQNIVWTEIGGVCAIVNLRGGGEYGKTWHEAGMKLNKQNVFDDFIAASEWLIAEGYTRKEKLAVAGGSNGGLLVGACLVQRPDLFGACLPAVGVLDMLRFNKFTIGWAWVSDYGSPEDPEEFKALYAYSPYHNIKDSQVFPATLVTTGDHDDRVFPGHSYKFAAKLQASQSGAAPVLIRIESKAGHGGGKPTSKRIEEQADRMAFLVENLKISLPD